MVSTSRFFRMSLHDCTIFNCVWTSELIVTFCGLFLERFGDGDTSQIGLDLDEVILV